MKTQWITHNGKKVLFTDFSNVKTQEELMDIMHDSTKALEAAPGKVLALADMTDAIVGGPEFMKEIKEVGKKYSHKNDKSAILGITGFKKILLKGYNLFTDNGAKAFSTKEEALDYLTS